MEGEWPLSSQFYSFCHHYAGPMQNHVLHTLKHGSVRVRTVKKTFPRGKSTQRILWIYDTKGPLRTEDVGRWTLPRDLSSLCLQGCRHWKSYTRLVGVSIDTIALRSCQYLLKLNVHASWPTVSTCIRLSHMKLPVFDFLISIKVNLISFNLIYNQHKYIHILIKSHV